ncbi:hypothetical protein [Dechloromonas sp. H13]|uniref:hypothetical protein n=1 Tax=Dechloromonas sp. H13 TaxID=2570193 RepID=UPI001290E295|nr:hypothetical protein [Dechloromonas sp. H13]
MPSYDELKSELESISKVVDRFPETVKPQVFDLLVRTFLGQALQLSSNAPLASPSSPSAAPPAKKRTRRRSSAEKVDSDGAPIEKVAPKRGASKESYKLDRELNLRGDKSIPGFKSFVEEKQPGSAKEFNAVAVYYLQKIVGLSQVTLNHAYTCYSEVGRRPPEAFRQSFIDTKNKEGWVEFDSEGNLRIPHRGSVFVEHDLPRQNKNKS